MQNSKRTLVVFFIVVASFFENRILLAQTPKNINQGINFIPGDFNTILTKAKAVKKPVFVEVYLNGCPHCEALAPVLTEKSVGDFFNANFISWKTEANSKESAAFQKSKGVTYPEFPIMFFFDSNGDLIHIVTPAERKTRAEFIEEVLSAGRATRDPMQRTGSYATRFKTGDRDLTFLINYGKYSKTIKDQATLTEINDTLGKLLTSPQDITSQAGFYILQRLVNDVDNPLSAYFFTHLNEFKSKYPAKDVKEAGEAILFHSLYGPKGDTYPSARIVEMRKDMIKLGVTETEASARLLLKELDAYLREKNTKAAVLRFNEYRKQAPSLGLSDYAYLMKYFNEKATDNSYLSEVPIWANEGIRLAKPTEVNTKVMAGLYYELAEAYWKMDKKPEAIKNAGKGLETAKTAKDDLIRFQEQVGRMK